MASSLGSLVLGARACLSLPEPACALQHPGQSEQLSKSAPEERHTKTRERDVDKGERFCRRSDGEPSKQPSMFQGWSDGDADGQYP